MACALIASAPGAQAQRPAGWGVYKGDWFEVGVPPGFQVSGPVSKPPGDTVHLGSKEGVVFSVFSPLWNGTAPFASPRTGEVVTEKDRTYDKATEVSVENLTIKAGDNSYVRFVSIRIDAKHNTNLTWGVQVPNMDVYAKIRPTYVKWKQTLTQFSD
ncbi:hypothetical protein DB346_20235 [Verrucomicrobia bacterium LW23]|nr:hypothetical protein DB346_20235 [Verrucomicrobia bacterium LW23]